MFSVFDWIFFGLFAGFCLLDTLVPARAYTKVRGWRAIGLIGLGVNYFIAGYAPLLWDEWLGAYRLFDASHLSPWVSIPAGFLILEFGVYVYHRMVHAREVLWRGFHQMHHAAERVDIYGAFYFHPLDMVNFALIGSVMLVGIFGMEAWAAAIVNMLAVFCSMFQHSNIRTPRWLGYIITRPESHALHHARGLHVMNYGDIPLYDILFGTFVNPERWDGEAGFFEGSTLKLGKLLTWRKLA